jgi:hypothetical protein
MAGHGTVAIQVHQIVRAYVHARGFVLALAAVAFFGTDECRHRYYLLVKNMFRLIQA